MGLKEIRVLQMGIAIAVLLILLVSVSAGRKGHRPDLSQLDQPAVLVLNGHSHNDYTRKRPLIDALNQGFCSLEIDVFLHKDKLIVSHINAGLNRKAGIAELYLEPLKEIIDRNGGTVYPGDSSQVVLMVDFKSEAWATYKKLNEILHPYTNYLHRYDEHENATWGPLRIVLSGSRPRIEEAIHPWRLCSADGRINEVSLTCAPHLFPRISASYSSQFSWKGKGEMPQKDRARLDSLTAYTDRCANKLRFWAMPQNERLWKTHLDAGVYWMNIDDLPRFRRFYLDYTGQEDE